MKPIAVAVEVIFGEIFVVLYAVAFANFANLCPGLGFDFDEFNIGSVDNSTSIIEINKLFS